MNISRDDVLLVEQIQSYRRNRCVDREALQRRAEFIRPPVEENQPE
jgi:hypothetical protein